MSTFRINDDEREALRGLPYLARLVYLLAIRPFMDYGTSVVGLSRGVNWQSLAEEMEIHGDRGIKWEKPSKGQLERAVAWLVKRGLLTWDKRANQATGKLVFSCQLAASDNCVSKKAIPKPYQSHTRSRTDSHTCEKDNICKDNRALNGMSEEKPDGKPDVLVSDPPPKAIPPPVSGNPVKTKSKKKGDAGASPPLSGSSSSDDPKTHPDAFIATPNGKKWGTETDLQISQEMFKAIQIISPTAKVPNWPDWANVIRLMRERDNRSPEEIRRLFAWANRHSFWGANILSPGKLREKWDRLTAQMRANGNSNPGLNRHNDRDFKNRDYQTGADQPEDFPEGHWFFGGRPKQEVINELRNRQH